MTIKELKEMLKGKRDDAVVYVSNGDGSLGVLYDVNNFQGRTDIVLLDAQDTDERIASASHRALAGG